MDNSTETPVPWCCVRDGRSRLWVTFEVCLSTRFIPNDILVSLPYRSDARGVAALVIGLNTKTESTAARHAPGATDQEEERKYAVV